MVLLLDFCPAISGTAEVSFRGRPLLRFGEMVGLASALVGGGGGGKGWSEGEGGVLGGLPRFLFTGVAATEFSLGAGPEAAGSLPGGVSVFLSCATPRPRPRWCCCSLSWAAMRDSVSSRRRTGRFLSTGMSGDAWGGEKGW